MRQNHHFCRRLLALLPALVFCLTLATPAAAFWVEPPFALQAEAIYIENLETGTVIFEKNADQRIYPASTTKIMTALVALERAGDLQESVAYPDSLAQMLGEINRRDYSGMLSMAGLVPGESLPLEQVLYGALLPSGNECAYMLAHHVGNGSVETFVGWMNQRAAELGANATHFANPAGLDDEQNYTTARDLARIARAAMEQPVFAKVVATAQHDGGPTSLKTTLPWSNTNAALFPESKVYYPPMRGIKTGATDEAGRCLVSIAEKDGLTYLMVLMKAPMTHPDGTPQPRTIAIEESVKLYEWAFDTLAMEQLVTDEQSWGTLPLLWAKDDNTELDVKVDDGHTALLPRGVTLADLEVKVELPEVTHAPMQEDAPLGSLTLSYQGKELATLRLVSGETAERSLPRYLLAQTGALLRRHGLKLAVAAGLLLAAMLLLRARNLRARRRRRPRR